MAVRLLALVLALATVAPTVRLADDLAFHAGGHHGRAEMPAMDAAAPDGAVDPGVTCHGHCGCHQLATLQADPVAPAPDALRPGYARVAASPVSVAPDRLTRPPRA
ncbi:hypothetical protein [Methylorubrum rhodesianum]|uniref:hypothetical protein n=1 Tax=Methylorubrum rhodesianum TaxID=29427 RepID=UPI001FEEA013|nr:hypothetical protein [Methylorubrum rhodesianum]